MVNYNKTTWWITMQLLKSFLERIMNYDNMLYNVKWKKGDTACIGWSEHGEKCTEAHQHSNRGSHE